MAHESMKVHCELLIEPLCVHEAWLSLRSDGCFTQISMEHSSRHGLEEYASGGLRGSNPIVKSAARKVPLVFFAVPRMVFLYGMLLMYAVRSLKRVALSSELELHCSFYPNLFLK